MFGRRGLIFKAGETLSEEKYDAFSNSNFPASKIMGFAPRTSGPSQRTRAVHASGKSVNIEAYQENTLEAGMNNKDEYLEILEKQVDQWQSEIMKFRLIAEVADKDDQIEHYQIIDDITDQINAFRNNLDGLKAESAGHWSGFQEKLQILKGKVNRAIDEARKKIN